MRLQTPSPTTWPAGNPERAERQGSRIELSWPNGESRSIAIVWLRDNCPCEDCRIAQTGEHRFFLGQLDALPDATELTLQDGVLSLNWTDGHHSHFAPSAFAHLTYVAARSLPSPEPWGDDFVPERFDREEILYDTDTRLAFMRASLRDGMTVVTSMGAESGECIRFLEALKLPVRDTPFDRLHDVYFHSDGYNVAHTDEPLPPHNDFASYQWPPSGQLIHMLVNEVAGGEWVNVDGFRVLRQLRQAHPDAVETLSRVPVAFREHSDSAESWTRAPIARIDSAGEIVGIRFSNQLMQPMDPTHPDLEAFYDAYHLLSRAVNDPANQIEFRGHAGTMQFLHAHRILHARRGFDGSSGPRHLQDTYFDFDDVASLTARIAGEAR